MEPTSRGSPLGSEARESHDSHSAILFARSLINPRHCIASCCLKQPTQTMATRSSCIQSSAVMLAVPMTLTALGITRLDITEGWRVQIGWEKSKIRDRRALSHD